MNANAGQSFDPSTIDPSGFFTLVVRRTGDQLTILHDHTSRARPAGQAPN